MGSIFDLSFFLLSLRKSGFRRVSYACIYRSRWRGTKTRTLILSSEGVLLGDMITAGEQPQPLRLGAISRGSWRSFSGPSGPGFRRKRRWPPYIAGSRGRSPEDVATGLRVHLRAVAGCSCGPRPRCHAGTCLRLGKLEGVVLIGGTDLRLCINEVGKQGRVGGWDTCSGTREAAMISAGAPCSP